MSGEAWPVTPAASDLVELVDAIAWPVAIGALVAILVFTKPGRQLTTGTLARLRRVKGFGVEVELNDEAARAAKASLEETFTAYRSAIAREYQRQAVVYDIAALLRGVIEEVVLPHLGARQKEGSFRATVHAPDALFAEALVQVVDYYPDGKGAGRAWPIRFGIIGRAWRRGRSEVRADVPSDENQLVDRWGMTSEEARAAGQGRHSFACLLLRHGGRPVGILYMDAEDRDLFGQKLKGEFDNSQAAVRLSEAVANAVTYMRKRGPVLTIFD